MSSVQKREFPQMPSDKPRRTLKFSETPLAGAFVIEPEPVHDERGFFARTFCEQEFAAYHLETRFKQHSSSLNVHAGTLRGMHFQADPYGEVKLVTCLTGAVFDVIVDLRERSASYGEWYGVVLSAANRRRLYIPKGLAHGFQTLEDDTELFYMISENYEPKAARGLRHDDPALGIRWPLPVSSMSEKDRAWPDFVPEPRRRPAPVRTGQPQAPSPPKTGIH